MNQEVTEREVTEQQIQEENHCFFPLLFSIYNLCNCRLEMASSSLKNWGFKSH